MTIKELKQAIADLPDNMDVFIEEMDTGLHFEPVCSVKVISFSFYEIPEDGDPLYREKALIISTL